MSPIKFQVIKTIGGLGLWKYVSPVHIWLYRASGGRIGHQGGGLNHLVLTTKGRRSGDRRSVALTYLADGERWLLVASNGGRSSHPAWWLNLIADPHAKIEVGAEKFEVIATAADGAERDRLWQAVVSYNPMYAEYEKMTKRRIPVVILQKA